MFSLWLCTFEKWEKGFPSSSKVDLYFWWKYYRGFFFDRQSHPYSLLFWEGGKNRISNWPLLFSSNSSRKQQARHHHGWMAKEKMKLSSPRAKFFFVRVMKMTNTCLRSPSESSSNFSGHLIRTTSTTTSMASINDSRLLIVEGHHQAKIKGHPSSLLATFQAGSGDLE